MMFRAGFFFPRNAHLLKTSHAFETPPGHHSFVLRNAIQEYTARDTNETYFIPGRAYPRHGQY